MSRKGIGIGIIVLMVAFLVVGMTGTAFATTGLNGGTTAGEPPAIGDPVTGTTGIAPHSGYSAATDFCLQCHSVHNAAGAYALMRSSSVVATCQTCHMSGSGATYQTLPNGATPAKGYDAGFSGIEGTVSNRTAYDLGNPNGTTSFGHTLGATVIPDGGNESLTAMNFGSYSRVINDGTDTNDDGVFQNSWATVDASTEEGLSGASTGGLYCASCHEAHGDQGGYLINTRKVWVEDVSGLTEGDNNHGAWGTSAQTLTEGLAVFSGGDKVFLHWDSDWGTVDQTVGTQTTAGENRMDAGWTYCQNDPTAHAVTPAAQDLDSVAGTLTNKCTYAVQTDADGGGNGGSTTNGAQTVSWYGYKLLSAYPNHTYDEPEGPASIRSGYRNHDEPSYCGRCHEANVGSDFPASWSDGLGTTTHSHPTGCSTCHDNNTALGRDAVTHDFPHSSEVPDLLKQIPDALCLSCHVAGALP